MLIGIPQSIVIVLLVLVYYIGDTLLMRKFDKLRERGSSRSWTYTIFAVLFALVLILQPIVWPWLSLQIPGVPGLIVQLVGVGLILAGLALAGWARWNLGQFFREGEEVQAGHRLIETGPYRYIRHPLYSSFFLMVTGLLLVNPSAPTLLAAVYAYVDFYTAASREEKMMLEKMPGYAGYIAIRPRFVPNLFRRSPAPKGTKSA